MTASSDLVANVRQEIWAVTGCSDSLARDAADAVMDIIDATIIALEADKAALVEALKRVDDYICDLSGEEPMMDYCDANPEEGAVLLDVRATLAKHGGDK